MGAKSRTLVFIVVSFLLGAVGGGFFYSNFYGQRRSGRPSHQDIVKEFTQRLKLEGNQPAMVDSILESGRRRFGEIRKEYNEALRAQRDSLRKEIRKILSKEQNLLYDQYIKEMEEREARYRRDNK